MYHPLLNFGLPLKYSPIPGPRGQALGVIGEISDLCVAFCAFVENSVMGLIRLLHVQCWCALRSGWFCFREGVCWKVMAGGPRDFSSGSSGLVSGTGSSWAAIPWLLETGISWTDTCSPYWSGVTHTSSEDLLSEYCPPHQPGLSGRLEKVLLSVWLTNLCCFQQEIVLRCHTGKVCSCEWS